MGWGEWVQNPDPPGGARLRRLIFNPSVRTPLRNGPATPPGWGGGGISHSKGAGMLVATLRGVNFGFWSYLGSSGQTPLYLAVKDSFRVARKEV